jgi:glycine cleavage system H protein
MAWKTPDNLKYQKSDEWVLVEGDIATIGITDYAQEALNDLTYVELPDVGSAVTMGKEFGEVESVKASSPLLSPVSGTVTEVNTALESEPELVNADPFGKGWIIKVRLTAQSPDLMDAAAYTAYCDGRH